MCEVWILENGEQWGTETPGSLYATGYYYYAIAYPICEHPILYKMYTYFSGALVGVGANNNVASNSNVRHGPARLRPPKAM